MYNNMGVTKVGKWVVVFGLVFALAAFDSNVVAAKAVAKGRVFDVTKYGAKGDGKPIYDEEGESINGLMVMAAWRAACEYKKGPTKVLIPNGTFVVGQTHFSGPCKSNVTIELQGTIIPDPDDSQFPNHLLLNFQNVDGVTLIGPGLVDAKNRGPPLSKDKNRTIDFFGLLPLITLYNVTNTVVDGINCKNPAAFHILVVLSKNITIKNVNFDGDILAPQSDTTGVYISASTQVTVSHSFIRTGDNCIIIAPGSSQVSVDNVTCSAGQGISIGADPIDVNALDVKNVTVKNCIFKETTFGASLFPRTEANQSEVSNIVFEDLLMENVKHSIVIHQQMPPRPNKLIQPKVKDVHIRNISGTSTSRFGVTVSCNPKLPCEGIEVMNIHLKYFSKPRLGMAGLGHLSANCLNPQVLFESKHDHDQLSCAIFN